MIFGGNIPQRGSALISWRLKTTAAYGKRKRAQSLERLFHCSYSW